MKLKSVLNKIAWVDLSSGSVQIEEPGEEVYLNFLGGYGIGAYYLFRRQPAKVNALGTENTLGFTTGPLTGTKAITGNRFTVIGSPPLEAGVTKGVTVNNETQLRDYFSAMGWNPNTGIPKPEVFKRLGLDFALEVTEP